MMNGTIANVATYGAVAALGWFGFFAGVGVGDVAMTINPAHQPKVMQLVGLHWKDGMIGQELIVKGGPVRGEWAASIVRPGGTPYVLCSGGGIHPYDDRAVGDIKWMTPSKWTGEQCPELQNGDVANVVWEWSAENGTKVSTSGKITITE